MTAENVEIVRRANDAWNRRDLETLLSLTHEDVEYVNSPNAVEPGTRRGRDQYEEVVRAQWEGLTEGRFEIERIYDREPHIVVLGRVSRGMPGGDGRIEDRALFSFELREGKAIRIEVLAVGAADVQRVLDAVELES